MRPTVLAVLVSLAFPVTAALAAAPTATGSSVPAYVTAAINDLQSGAEASA